MLKITEIHKGNMPEKKLSVAAYCRVSTDEENQKNSYSTQISYYTDYITSNPDWQLAGIYADEGISGTMTKNRTQFNKMIRAAKNKKIDIILCKSISRFARNTVDCLDYVRELRSLGVTVIFEKENINTSSMSHVYQILQNEKYVGDAILQKTYTVNCITHDRKKNHGQKPMYLIQDCHDAIIDRKTYDTVRLELEKRRRDAKKGTKEKGRYVTKYCLSRLLICPYCGGFYKRTTWLEKGGKIGVWRCKNRMEGKRCPNSSSYHEDALQRAVISAVNNMISHVRMLRGRC